jgi:hypothetical protein
LNDNGDSIPVPDGHFQLEDIHVNDTLTLREPSIGKVREGKVSKVKDSVEKKSYGEFQHVQLSDDEYKKLVDSLNEEAVLGLITELDTYVASTGKKYKSHYATLQNWARRRIQEHRMKVSNQKPKVL